MTTGGPLHELYLSRPDGTRISLIDTAQRFDYTRALNDTGTFTLTLPGDFDDTFLQDGYRVEFWYKPEGGTIFLDFLGFIHKPNYITDQEGRENIIVTGIDPIGLLKRHHVAYDSGTSQAKKSGAADDVMKEIVDENFSTSATDTDRRISTEYLTVAGIFSLGPTVSKSFARRNVLTVLREIGADAFENGTPVYFDLVRISQNELQFQTFINQRGRDQRFASGSGLVFSTERGNLRVPDYSLDFSDEVNAIYVGGQGQGTDRQVVQREDTTRTGRNIWARREKFIDQRNTNATASLNSEGDSALRAGIPRKRFSGELVSTDETQYGRDWNFGDRVSAEAYGQIFDGIIRAINVSRDGKGYVAITARLEVEE
jgi:hypothetical protein